MANEFFQASSIPQTNSQGSSAAIRGEFSRIALGFDKLPAMAGKPNKVVRINGTGSAMTTGALTDDGTVVAVTGDVVVTALATQTLENKTLAWDDNTWTGFNNAATKVAGTGADNVLLLTVSGQLPALDGSLLTNMTLGQFGGVLPIAQGGTGATNAPAARTALGLGSIATQSASNVTITGGAISGIVDLEVADGGTGASSPSAARNNLGAAASGANSDITSLAG
jgi:hypothetical protein